MLREVFEALRQHLSADEPVVLATTIAWEPEDERNDDANQPRIGSSMLVRRDGSSTGSLGSPGLDWSVRRDALGHLDSGVTAMRHYGRDGEAREEQVTVFIEAFSPPPQMIIFGAVDFSASLARVAKTLGYRVTICDPRPVFATSTRFPMADEVVVDWPDRYLSVAGASLGPRDAICVLTHDRKFDIPALRAAVDTDAGYIGAMGSRRTTDERATRLREAGLDEAALSRIFAPMGLDIGARTTEETAISICAEIIAARASNRTGASLRTLSGPIHDRPEK